MKNQRTSKMFLIAMLYTCCMLLEACNTDDCNFGPVLPFTTFEAIEASPSSLTVNEANPLIIEVALEGVDYVAFQHPKSTSFFSTVMYGCLPPPKGGNGLKNPMISIDITAIEDLDDMYLAGSSLNELFEVEETSIDQNESLAELNAESKINELFIGDYGGVKARSFILQGGYPAMRGDYNFLIKMTFETGDPIELALETVTFE